MMNNPPSQPPKFSSWPMWTQEDLQIVSEVVSSGKWWSGAPAAHAGEHVWAFNSEFAELQGVKHVLACTNGTHAIEIALMALGIGHGDEVLVSDWTFVATGSAVVAVGAVPIFVDITPDTFLLNPALIENLITERTKAIICVHLGGMPCEMDVICEIAQKHDLKVIEDCAHAHGSRFKGKAVGAWGDIGTFSFQASKLITSGEGGAVVTDHDEWIDPIYQVLDSGRQPGTWFYDHFVYGSDFRLGEFQAAILRTQMKKFPAQHALRQENAAYLEAELRKIPGIYPQKSNPGVESVGRYVFPIYFDPQFFRGINYSIMYRELRRAEIPADDCYPPLHRVDLFKNLQLKPGIDYSGANFGGEKSNPEHFPVVERIHATAFELSHRILLSEQSAIDYVIEVIAGIQKQYGTGGN